MDRDSGDDYSDDTEYRKPKSVRIERKRVPDRVVVDNRHSRRSHHSNDDDVTSLDELKPRRPARRGDHDEKMPDVRRERESSRQRREYVEYSSEHDALVLPGRQDREVSRSQKTRRIESNSKHINVSGENRYRSSKKEMPEDLAHSDLPPEPQDLRVKLGRKREKERQERRHHVYEDAEVEETTTKGEEIIEKPKYKRHSSRSKSKGEEPVEFESDDSKRKQKRKHRKHFEDTTGERPRDSREKDLEEPVVSRKLKSKGASNPPNNSIEVTRWQLVDSELDEGHSSHSYHAKKKSQRSYRS